jgi:hypothetical protein
MGMGKIRNVHKIMVGKLERNRHLGRHKRSWDSDRMWSGFILLMISSGGMRLFS